MEEDTRDGGPPLAIGAGPPPPRRGANTLPGILQYVAGIEGADISVPTTPMTEERRQFLSEALQSLTTDHVKRLQQLMNILSKPEDHEDQTGVEEKEDALEELIDWCDDIDFGSDFLKMGGVEFLHRFIDSEHSGFRWRILDIMATILQNNQWAQDEAREKAWLGIFIKALEKDPVNLVRIKGLYAISCTVREHDVNRREFLDKYDGLSVLLRASQSDVEKLQVKSIFLMTSIVNADPSTCDPLHRMGIVEQLVGLAFQHVDSADADGGISGGANSDANFLTEHVLSALCFFASTHSGCLEDCRRPDLPLKSTVEKRLAQVKDDEQFEEERHYAKKLLTLLDGRRVEGDDDNTNNCDTER